MCVNIDRCCVEELGVLLSDIVSIFIVVVNGDDIVDLNVGD